MARGKWRGEPRLAGTSRWGHPAREPKKEPDAMESRRARVEMVVRLSQASTNSFSRNCRAKSGWGHRHRENVCA